MVISVSIYPFLAKSTGFTRIYSDDEIEESGDAIKQVELMRQCIHDVLERHSDDEMDDEDVNEYERYTVICLLRKSLPLEEFPFTISHARPEGKTYTKAFYHMTKKEIWDAALAEVESYKEALS